MSTGKLEYWNLPEFQYSNGILEDISQYFLWIYSNISSVIIGIWKFSRMSIFLEFSRITVFQYFSGNIGIVEFSGFLIWNIGIFQFSNIFCENICILEFSRTPIFQYSNMSSENIAIWNFPWFQYSNITSGYSGRC